MTPAPSSRPVLLVEDNPTDKDLTLLAFARRGVANPVEVARDGEEALAWLPRWEAGEPLPVVVLLDLKLPKVDGLEVLQQYKAHPRVGAVPVVVLSSSAQDADMRAAYRLGANSYLVKPVNFDQFMEVVGYIDRYWCQINRGPG